MQPKSCLMPAWTIFPFIFQSQTVYGEYINKKKSFGSSVDCKKTCFPSLVTYSGGLPGYDDKCHITIIFRDLLELFIYTCIYL